MSLTMPTTLYPSSTTSNKEIHTTSTISDTTSRTQSFLLASEPPSYTSPPSYQVTTSFRPTQTVHVSTTPLLRDPPAISNERLSLIASLSTTTILQPPTANTNSQSTPVDADRELSIFRGKTNSTQSLLPRMTLRSDLHLTNTVIAFSSVFVNESMAMNQTLAHGDQQAMIDKVRWDQWFYSINYFIYKGIIKLPFPFRDKILPHF